MRLWVISVAALGVGVSLMWLGRPSSARSTRLLTAAQPVNKPLARDARLLVGAGSCSAVACHNGIHNEYTTWITRDPHARAYQVLFDKTAVRIQNNLHASRSLSSNADKPLPAHRDSRCLGCHAFPHLNETPEDEPTAEAAYFPTDGVSCESCHGAARHWLAAHVQEPWSRLSVEQKARLGFRNTKSLVQRARVCAECHVGGKGMEVDHDLLAAGHPSLHFEFAAFHAHMPRHWPDASDRASHADFEARAWLIGQLVSAQRSLELLAERAGDANHTWPEFAEYDCASCHHDLSAKRRGNPNRAAGLFPWSNPGLLVGELLQSVEHVDAGLVKEVETALGRLRKEMNKALRARRDVVRVEARKVADCLDQVIASLERDLPATLATSRLGKQIAVHANSERSHHEITQVFLGLKALQQAIPATKQADFEAILQDLNDRLRLDGRRFETSPFEPEAIRARLGTPGFSKK